MKIIGLKMKAISPLQYYYIPANGGMRTSPFIGDIALKYAFLRQLGEFIIPDPKKTKPTYEELNNFDFWITVAIPEVMAFGNGKDAKYMKNMIRNTMQGIDYNGSNEYPTFKTGSSMYKNFFFVQLLAPGNEFYSYLIYNENRYNDFKIPEAIRVGNNRTGILKIEKCNKDFRAALNMYTLNNIMKKKVYNDNRDFHFHIIVQYYISGFYNKDEVVRIYG